MLEIARLVRRPGPRFGIVSKIVRIGEVQRAADVIECLSRTS
jgi:hypothetical protein